MQTDAFNEHSIKQSKGSVNPYVNFSDLAWYEFALPSKDEQRRIAEILWAAEDAYTAATRVVGNLDTSINVIAENLFPIPLSAPVNHQSRHNISMTSIQVLADITAPDAPIRYGIVQVGKDAEGGIPTLAIKDLGGDFRTGIHRSATSIESRYAGSRVIPGDVLISVKGTIGKVDVVPDYFAGNISRDVARIRLVSDIEPWYLAYLLRSPKYQKQLAQVSVGSTRQEISIHLLRRLPVVLPSKYAQMRAVNVMKRLHLSRQEAVEHRDRIHALNFTLREQLLAQLYEGCSDV